MRDYVLLLLGKTRVIHFFALPLDHRLAGVPVRRTGTRGTSRACFFRTCGGDDESVKLILNTRWLESAPTSGACRKLLHWPHEAALTKRHASVLIMRAAF